MHVTPETNRTMNHDLAHRRRIATAAAITLIAIPSVFLFGRGESSSTPDITVVGTTPGMSSTFDTQDAPDDSGAMGTTPLAYLEGDPFVSADDGATIAIPRLPRAIVGSASFRRDIESVTTCQVAGLPINSKVTVRNLDNSRTVQCIASISGVWIDHDIVLHPDAFAQIADLTDAPIHVEITW